MEEQWFFGEEPMQVSTVEESLWQSVLSLKIETATHIEFTLMPRQKVPKILSPFDAFLERKFVSSWRYGAQVPLRGKVLYLRYILAPPLTEFVRRIPSLYAWMDDLPEDPALYLHSRVLVWTISHEGYIYARLTHKEASELRSQGFRLEECVDCPEWLHH